MIMTIWSINLYVFIAAIFLSLLLGQIRKPKKWWLEILKNFIGSYFVFSGVVKAIDPVGTGIKMEEYFEIFHEYFSFLNPVWSLFEPVAVEFSIFMILLEIVLGFFLIMGALKGLTLSLFLLIIVFFTFLTGFSHITGKVTDCGCFGDFIKLTPFQSFIKDIVLLLIFLPLLKFKKDLTSLFPEKPRFLTLLILTLLSITFTMRNVYYEPIVDFRAYQVGVNIPQCLSLPEDAKPYIYENVFVYKNKASGEISEFSIESLPSDFENWDFVDRKDKLVQKGDDPKCKDFAIADANGTDVASSYMEEPSPLLVLILPDLKKTNREGLSKMAEVFKDAQKAGYYTIALTGSSIADVQAVLSDYDFNIDVFNTDATPLKTIMRSNPGLLILKEGTVLAKYHYHDQLSFKKIKEAVLD
jgi:uncharacterized membrane protein YphA (DoxX/SURF4 family)